MEIQKMLTKLLVNFNCGELIKIGNFYKVLNRNRV